MEPADVLTDRRYSLCTMNENGGHKVIAIEHSDDLAAFVPTINAGGTFMVVRRGSEERIADPLAQWVPVLEAYEIANITYVRMEILNGIGRGNGRSFTGRFTPNYRFTHANPFTVEDLNAAIEAHYQLRLSTLPRASAAQ